MGRPPYCLWTHRYIVKEELIAIKTIEEAGKQSVLEEKAIHLAIVFNKFAALHKIQTKRQNEVLAIKRREKKSLSAFSEALESSDPITPSKSHPRSQKKKIDIKIGSIMFQPDLF